MEVVQDESLLSKYFDLTEDQRTMFAAMGALYADWNQKINVISRKDIEKFYERHVLHSLAIHKYVQFMPGTKILDLGTGGGFPGVPMAIMNPECQFVLIDGTAKKIRVVQAVVQELGLANVSAVQLRAEECKHKFDFVTARAVTGLDRLKDWSQRLMTDRQINAVPNGLITLKGGNPKDETKLISKSDYTEVIPLGDYFDEDFFESKYLLYLQL